MTEQEQQKFENDMRRVAPAAAPEELTDRLHAARPSAQPANPVRPNRISGSYDWLVSLRWLVAATPVIIAVIAIVRIESRPHIVATKPDAAAAGITANDVRVDHALVSSYDAVAQLPNGEPVRFRCNKWMDDVVMKDKSHGLVIQQSSPRVEVIPVRFETY